jgi:hypothetical protein
MKQQRQPLPALDARHSHIARGTAAGFAGTAQRARIEGIQSSPPLLLQKHRVEQLAGSPARPAAMPAHPPLQAVWEEVPDRPELKRWDASITGIRWYFNTVRQTYFYRVDPGEHWYGPADPIRAGQDQEHPYEAWHTAGRERVGGIQGRVHAYENDFGLERDVGNVRGKEGAKYVDDTLPAKFNFLHKGQDTATHFANTYSPEAAIMRENYRTPDLGKSFFASDVFFSQLAVVASGGKSSGDLLKTLPPEPPAKIVRDTIDNDETKKVLNAVNASLAAELTLVPSQPEFGQVLQTPNGKATFNLLNDFNFINRARELPAYTIARMVIRKSGDDPATGWKIELHLAPG